MDCLWDADHALSVREVYEAMLRHRHIAYTTIATTLQRMARKGLITQERNDRAFRYRPIATRHAMFSMLISEALDVASNDPGLLLRFFDQLDPDTRAIFRHALG